MNFKLIEMDDKYHLLKRGAVVVDLGAAPGGWSQIAIRKVGAKGKVVGIDLQEVEPIPGVHLEVMDFLEQGAPERLRAMVGGGVDLVLSDMAASASGHKATDHIKIMALCEVALDFAEEVLKPGGDFVVKLFQGTDFDGYVQEVRSLFSKVQVRKPKASRPRSREVYLLARGRQVK